MVAMTFPGNVGPNSRGVPGAARTAFVGRTLRGPVNQPVTIRDFAHFQRIFGGLWQPSLLGYAVEHFFDNGGREAVIVRVVNGARAATLRLPAGREWLVLQAVRPGTREFLRAGVDYDNVADDTEFNLTIQRVRSPGAPQVEDQEIYRALSVAPESVRHVGVRLAESALLRAVTIPRVRPDRSLDPASGIATGYIHSICDGDDGAPLTDYDLIGSVEDRTGLFALARAEPFNFLCIPPIARDRAVGHSTLLVAARYCRQRRALLIVDPPAEWQTAEDALRGLRDWPLASEDAVMYFPRILAHDKLRGRFETFAPCGAAAGLLSRSESAVPSWGPAETEEPVLRPGYRPSCLVTDDRRAKLAAAGVNTLSAVRSAGRPVIRQRTLAAGRAANVDWKYLSTRRFALYVLNGVERRARRLVGSRLPSEAGALQELVRWVDADVRTFFAGLHRAGSFAGRSLEDACFVVCDERLNSVGAGGEFKLVIGFAAERPGECHCFRITLTALASRVEPVTRNRFEDRHYGIEVDELALPPLERRERH